MANSLILNLPLVAPNQNQKETTINSALAILEAASNASLTLTIAGSGSTYTLTTENFTRYMQFRFAGQPNAKTINVPTTPRFFAVYNTGAYTLTIKATGSSGTVAAVEAGARVLIISDGTNVVGISGGVTQLASLTDVANADEASAGQVLAYNSTTGFWEPVDSLGDVSFFVTGIPLASQKVLLHSFARSCTFFGDFSGSQAKAQTGATAAKTFLVFKNATQVGTINWASGATVATFTTTSGNSVDFAPGDVLIIQAPASPDSTLADISCTLKGVLQ